MAKVTLLFYRAFDNPNATLLDKLVAWLDGGWCCSSWASTYLGWANADVLGVEDARETALLIEA